jgi:DNA-binding response OmpR family regulator
MDGEELLRWVRSQPVHQNTPYIMITATRERETITKILKAGANAYLIKPFTMDDLLQKIVHLNRRQHERFEIDGSAVVNFRNNKIRARIIDVSKGGMFGLFESRYPIPSNTRKGLCRHRACRGRCSA